MEREEVQKMLPKKLEEFANTPNFANKNVIWKANSTKLLGAS